MTERKVVYNACFGGYSLSNEAVMRYLEIKGITIYPEKSDWGYWAYWYDSPETRIEDSESYFEPDEIERHDPILVQVVEELGAKAAGDFAKLRIKTVNGPYRIDEYDGLESVMTPEDYSWH